MSNSNLKSAVFVRRGAGFATEEPIEGEFGLRVAVLDSRSHRNCKPGETWTYIIRGANKIDQEAEQKKGKHEKKREPLYFVQLVKKVADAPTLQDIVARAQSGAAKKQEKKPATTCDAEERARALFAPRSHDPKDLSSLGLILGSQRAKTDAVAIGIAGGIGCMERMLECNRADEVAVMSTLHQFIENDFDEGLATVTKLAEARREKQSILDDGRKYASACGQAKRISGEGEELPAHLTEAALAEAKSMLDQRRDALKALLSDGDGKVDNTLTKLDRDVLNYVDPWWGDRQEARAKVDQVVNAVASLERIQKERNEHLEVLAELVNQYEARLAELVA